MWFNKHRIMGRGERVVLPRMFVERHPAAHYQERSANLLNTEVMQAKVLEADQANKHKYNIVATYRETGKRESILDRLTHSQVIQWEPNNYYKKWYKYFKVVKVKQAKGSRIRRIGEAHQRVKRKNEQR